MTDYDPPNPRVIGGGKSRKAKKQEEITAPPDSEPPNLARDQLRNFVERIERLEEERKEIGDDVKSVYGEAKAMGFDSKVLRRVIAIRKQDPSERMEMEAILDTYLHALGMAPDPASDRGGAE